MFAPKFQICVFASGSGTNAEKIFKYFQDHPTINVALLLSNNAQAYALERAKKFNVAARAFTKEEFKGGVEILNTLQQNKITHIVLAGFLWLIPDYLIHSYPKKIVNIHPALLPKFGGKGMFGLKVHEAVKTSGEKETGITIHLVNDKYDEGEILFQASCPVSESYSPEKIRECVQQLEYENYPKVIEKWILNQAIMA